MHKDIEYYMSLRYPIEVQELELEAHMRYFVCIPQLGSSAVNGIGNTVDEAIKCMNDVKRDIFESLMEHDVPIPEPETDDFRNRTLRITIPKDVFYDIVTSSIKSNIHLNDLIVSVLKKYFKSKSTLFEFV